MNGAKVLIISESPKVLLKILELFVFFNFLQPDEGQQMQVCYLMRIGLSKTQIQNMTNLSRSTVWRWVKKYDWVHAEGK